MAYSITYNGTSSESLGLIVTNKPCPAAAMLTYADNVVPGRDGSLYTFDGSVSDIAVTVAFAFKGATEAQVHEKYYKAKAWLLQQLTHKPYLTTEGIYVINTENNVIDLAMSGERMLSFSDDTEGFYRVKYVSVDTSERIAKLTGMMEATFICQGYRYLVSGASFVHRSSVSLTNNYQLCKPVYKLVGDARFTITTNGKTFAVNATGTTYVDSEQMITFRDDGTICNADATGDYESLWYLPGTNTQTASASASGCYIYIMTRRRTL